jgi:hypothetical protein
MSVLIFSSPTGPPEPFADMFVDLWIVVGIGEACSVCWREKRLLWWVRVLCTRKRPDQCFQSFSRRCWQRLRAGGCVGMISQRWSSNALFGRRWMIQCGAVCNADGLVLQCSVRPARVTTARMGTWTLYSSAHFNRDTLGCEPRSCVLLSGVRYKRPLANTCGAPSGQVGRKWTRAGTELFAIITRRETGVEELDDVEDGHAGLDQYHLGIIWKFVLASPCLLRVDYSICEDLNGLQSPGLFMQGPPRTAPRRIFSQAFARAARP